MKPILTITLLYLCSYAQGQSFEIPAEEFSLFLPVTKFEVMKGDTLSVEVYILRAHGYKKAKVRMGSASGLPIGLSLTVEPNGGVIERSNAKLVLTNEIPSGIYRIVITATTRLKTKGSILTLVVR
jgi:hypothetical protein